MNVADVMSRDPACCTPDTSLQDVARMMVENDCGAIPVVNSMQDMKPVGMITDRDITVRAVAQGKNPLGMTAGECMSQPPITIGEQESLDDCEELMKEHQIRRVIVLDKQGRCCGIVTQANLARKASDEEIAGVVREISQPHHHAAPHAKM
ncbi:MAG: CBS domain-containing protein [Pseudomonadota bacterium]